MKRYLTLMLLLVLFITAMVGCANDNNDKDETSTQMSSAWNAAHMDSKYFDSEIIEEGNGYYIVRDKHTNAMYLITSGFRSSVMTPIYNSDGTIKTYQEETTNEN